MFCNTLKKENKINNNYDTYAKRKKKLKKEKDNIA